MRLSLLPEASSVSRKIQGFPIAPRAIMTPSQPVSCEHGRRVTGAEQVAAADDRDPERVFSAPRIFDQSALPSNICARVRGWRVTASHPSSSAIRPISRKFAVSACQPVRILIVRGRDVARRTALTIAATFAGSCSRALPAPVLTTFRTGHPMLMSIRSPCIGYQPRGFRKQFRIVAEELDAERPVGRGAAQEIEGLAAIPDEAVYAHHLGEAERRSLLPCHKPHRQVRYARHRGEYQIVGQGEPADCEGCHLL